jgi:hypothetical protein
MLTTKLMLVCGVLLAGTAWADAFTIDLYTDAFGSATQRYTSFGGLVSNPGAFGTTTEHNSGTALGQTNAFLDTMEVNGADNARGYSFANLATGSIGTGAFTSPNVGGQARADFSDTISFLNTNATAVPIDVFVSLHGSITGPSTASEFLDWAFCMNHGIANCVVGSTTSGFRFEFGQNSGLTPNGITLTEPTTDWVSTAMSPGNSTAMEVWHGVFSVPAGASTDLLALHLDTRAGLGGNLDYTNTSALSFNLPAGVSITGSGSGVLLTAPATTVPEPGSLALAGTAVLGVLACTRFRRRRAR